MKVMDFNSNFPFLFHILIKYVLASVLNLNNWLGWQFTFVGRVNNYSIHQPEHDMNNKRVRNIVIKGSLQAHLASRCFSNRY